MKNTDFDALARLLDGDLPEGEATAEARALSSLAQALSASAATPQMERKADLRAMLVEAAREQGAAPTLLARLRQSATDTTARWRYSTRLAAATGAGAMALSSGGVALAAANSTPEDGVFYSVRLTYEDIRVAFISDPVERGRALLAYAEQRLAEAEAAAAAGDMDAARRALAEADHDSRAAAGFIIKAAQDQDDPSLLAILDEFSKTHRKRLAALLPSLTGEAAVAAEDAMIGLRRIGERVAVLSGPCTQCGMQPARGDRTEAEQAAAADPDFDFSKIPPASEPFAPCPCVTEDPDNKAKADAAKGVKKKGAKAKKPASEPAKTGTAVGSGGQPADDEPAATKPGDGDGGGGEDPGDESPSDELPEPVREPVKDAEEVIEDVLKNPPSPTPLPPLPDLPEADDLLP